jgi:A/G-specific adenine glycosylase
MRPDEMETKIVAFGRLLLKWYFAEDKRSFPWRDSRNPYHILLAEVMLQRTKADQVVPIFQSFIQEFPSAETLSKASVSEIEGYFSKLGLLWRAKNVKRLAEKLVADFGGEVPKDRNQLMSLPAIGEYIADAILCFAYGKKVATVDSNVCRIIGRVFGLKPKGEARRDPVYRKIAEQTLPRSNCRKFNWGLIDLAFLICLPKKPQCQRCPFNRLCEFAKERGIDSTN